MQKAWNFAKENQIEEVANLLWNKMSEATRENSAKLYKPPPPKNVRSGKLSAKLIALQEAVRKPQT